MGSISEVYGGGWTGKQLELIVVYSSNVMVEVVKENEMFTDTKEIGNVA